jgi:hypothetical protein
VEIFADDEIEKCVGLAGADTVVFISGWEFDAAANGDCRGPGVGFAQ